MEKYEDMTPIELNVLINKTKERQEIIKSEILIHLDEIKFHENKINSELEEMKEVEDKYVNLISVLMSKQ